MAKMGRPLKYNDKIIEKTKDYIENYKKYGDEIPMVDGLALELGVHRDTINDWEHKYPDFSDFVRILMTSQGRKLMNGSLNGEFREKTATLALSSHHGLVAKQELDIKGEMDMNFMVEFVDPDEDFE